MLYYLLYATGIRGAQKTMKATIIIPNINGKGWLERLHRVGLRPDRTGFRTHRGGQRLHRREPEQAGGYFSQPNFTLIEDELNTGFSHAVNKGIARAKSELVGVCSTTMPCRASVAGRVVPRRRERREDLRRPEPYDPPLRPRSWPTTPATTSHGWALPARLATDAGPAGTPDRSASSRPAAARPSTARASSTRSAS